MQRQSRRFQHLLALRAASMPVQHVAAVQGLDWGTVRRAEQHALERWDRRRTPPPLRHLGIDEKYLGRRHKRDDRYVTIVSNLQTGEPLWMGYGRSEATVTRWLATLSPERKVSMTLAATFGAVSVRDITLTTGGRLEALSARVDRVEAGAAHRDGDNRTTREAVVRLEATLEALRSSLATRLDSIDQRLQRGPAGR